MATHRETTMKRSARPMTALLSIAALLLAACGGGPDRANDPQAARALFDRALTAEFSGDTIAAQDLLLTLAAHHPETRHGQAARARLGSGQAMMTATAVAGILAAVAIPAFMKYVRRSKTSEASLNVRKLFDSAVSYYHYSSEQLGPDKARFPASTELTPDAPFCVDGESGIEPTATAWDGESWQALNFAIGERHNYRYQFISEGTGKGAMFTARAMGDLDCDGVLSTFERVGFVGDDGIVSGGAGLFIANELE